MPAYFRALERATEGSEANDVYRALALHAAIWAVAGLAAGLALGLGAGGPVRRAVAGALGGALAAMVYAVTAAVAFPTDSTGLPVDEIDALRALAHLLPALAVAACATLADETPPVGALPGA
jgi:hypothetical protein